MAQQSRILLVDYHPAVRSGVSVWVEKTPDMRIVAETSSADTAIDLTRELTPDVVVMEIIIPGADGITVIQAMQKCHAGCRFVILTASVRDRDIDAALRAGVHGFISKQAPAASVVTGIRTVARGRTYFCEVTERRIVVRHRLPANSPQRVSRAGTLAPRELEILRHLSVGLSVKDVANLLRISSKTVDSHKRGIMSKLDIHNRIELSRFAVREGLVEL